MQDEESIKKWGFFGIAFEKSKARLRGLSPKIMEPYTRAYSLALQLDTTLQQLPANHPDTKHCQKLADRLVTQI